MSSSNIQYIINYWPKVPEAFEDEEWKHISNSQSNLFRQTLPHLPGCRRIFTNIILPYRSKEWIQNEKYSDYQPPTPSDATHIRVWDTQKESWRMLRIAGISGIKCYTSTMTETFQEENLSTTTQSTLNEDDIQDFHFGVPVKNSSFYYRIIRGIIRMQSLENKVYRYHKLDGTTRDIYTDRETTLFNRYLRVWDIENHGWRTLIRDRIEDSNEITPNFSQIIST